jgi:hypothetical protein
MSRARCRQHPLVQVGAAKLLGITDRTARQCAAGDAEVPEALAFNGS